MTDITFIGYLVGGLASLLGLYFLVDKLKEKDRVKLEDLTREVNASNKELTKAINRLTTTVELMNNNMVNIRKDLDDVDLGVEKFKDEIRTEITDIRKFIRDIDFKCALEHGKKKLSE